MIDTKIKAYYADFANELQVAKFPEDFADWLMDEGREQDARQFLLTIKNWATITPESDQHLEDLIDIAEEYAPVVNFHEEIRSPTTSYQQALALLRDLEMVDEPSMDDDPLPWDREAALVNQTLADMPDPDAEEGFVDHATPVPTDLSFHEFPDVNVYVDDGDTITAIMGKTVQALMDDGYEEGARGFLLDLRRALQLGPIDMMLLAWSYVVIQPEHGSQIAHRIMRRT